MPILLAIDDSPSVRQMIRVTFASAGFEIIEASDGLEGLQKATSTHIDIVVTDLNMPRMNGLAFIRHLRARPTYHSLPIIVLTTESDQAALKEASAAGASAWITKPFNVQGLLDIARGLLQ
ncbi:MAG: response regulator [Proteobacteria bacterium]|nr:response regulator [Pseudomonadota bacterium]